MTTPSYDHIFQVEEKPIVNVKRKPKAVIDDSKKFAKELGTLNYGIAVKEREYAAREEKRFDGKREKQSTKTTQFAKLSDMFNLVDQEISDTLHKTSWKRLTSTYKWKFAKIHILKVCKENNIDKIKTKEILTHLKSECSKWAKVDYDMENTVITKLNITYAELAF